jgi:hypothetical protein
MLNILEMAAQNLVTTKLMKLIYQVVVVHALCAEPLPPADLWRNFWGL